MNQNALLSAFENRLRQSNTPCKQIQPLSRIKMLNGQRNHGVILVGEQKVYGGKDLLNSQVLNSEWKNEWVREYESGDSEDGEDKLPCVIGGEREGDGMWQG